MSRGRANGRANDRAGLTYEDLMAMYYGINFFNHVDEDESGCRNFIPLIQDPQNRVFFRLMTEVIDVFLASPPAPNANPSFRIKLRLLKELIRIHTPQ